MIKIHDKVVIQEVDLRRLLKIAKISQAELAQKSGVSLALISKAINGKYQMSYYTWNKIKQFLPIK